MILDELKKFDSNMKGETPMDPTLALITFIIELIAKYGVPATIQIIQTWQMESDPTIEDIMALRALVPDGASYFPKEEPEPA